MMEIEKQQIIRTYYFETYKEKSDYPRRYTADDFDELDKLLKNKNFEIDYEKLKTGINPLTNRKIKIGGKIYCKIEDKFKISGVLFVELKKYNKEQYLQETNEIYSLIDKENNIINEYNKSIRNIIKKIKELKKWNDFIEYEGIKYGIPNVLNNIHRTNDCFGNMKETCFKSCSCHLCEDWGGCNNPKSTQYYKCEKCNYTYSSNSTSSRWSAGPFWWK